MGIPHKHAEVIKAWADGAEIQVNNPKEPNLWFPFQIGNSNSFSAKWDVNLNYRIKPPKKSPGQVYFEAAYPESHWGKTLSCYKQHEQGAKAVIEAYKRGEFDEDCRC